MYDLQLIYPAQLIELTAITTVSTLPPVIQVEGKDFRYVDDVLINDQSSPQVTVLSQYKLTAALPAGLLTTDVNTVRVVSARLTLTPDNLLMFKLDDTPRAVSGIHRLIQRFCFILLKTPGTGLYNKGLGGGLRALIGRSMIRADGSSIVADAHLCVQRAERQLLALQAAEPRTPRSEKLLSAKIEASYQDPRTGGCYLTIALANQESRGAAVNMQL